MNPKPAIRLLKECFVYHPLSGKLFWQTSRPEYHLPKTRYKIWKTRFSGKEVISENYLPEVNFTVDGITYKMLSSVACWAMASGKWPTKFIDHKNGNPRDNRLSNLRQASQQQNTYNSKTHKDNKSGFKGVFWAKHANMYASQICKSGKRKHLGYFADPKKAHEAYVAAADSLFGRFARYS